ncbi:hypothetical protein [Aquimarina sp. AU119]|uniref:hypothetical protein n=1 Tax=Aquimarina sp. AU119 TaxID=2108528 RepID=UPI000D696199|nr:hypothetical protein [Aquimarina sp. AU119]
MEITLSKYGNIISTDDTSGQILRDIKEILEKETPITINALNVVISTKSARLIFGYLYRTLTKFKFNKSIQFKNASQSFMFAVNEGILTEMEQVN